MDLGWLEDFLAVVDHGGFSRAAEKRNVSQPAFSRRVQALESWIGAPLFDRSTHAIALTPAGEHFKPIAEEILRRLYCGRDETQETARMSANALRFASTNALSLTFFPGWLRSIERENPLEAVHLAADNMAACERIMLQGQAQFLLCHHHPSAQTSLGAEQFQSVHVGDDLLLPVCAPDPEKPAAPKFPLEEAASAGRSLPYLAYSAASGMGRIISAVRSVSGTPAGLQVSFISHVATILAAMARDGRGLAWSPLSIVAEDLEQGRLVRAGGQTYDIPIEIHLFRPRARQPEAAERLWAFLTQRAAGK